jgi:hypothetical protein
VAQDAHVIILVHGIRDYALWQDRIRNVLKEHFTVESTNYGRFDLLRFLVPLSHFRNKAIESVWDQIRDVKKQYPDAKFSFVAHSFGTYILAQILSREFDFSAHQVVFCGSVVKYNFPFEQIADRFTTPILNEVGAKDVWPAIAESLTWGYGSAGTYGFRRPRVRDRWHSGARHGYFLNPEFCKEYWCPFFKEGVIVDGADDPEVPAVWLKALSVIRLKYVLLTLLAATFLTFGFVSTPREILAEIFGPRVCYPYDPISDKPDKLRPRRDCVSGELSYVKWIDENAYSATDRETGRYPNDRANRALSMTAVEPNGTRVWAEQNLTRIDSNRAYWPVPSSSGWTEIAEGSTKVLSGHVGALLRRQDPDRECVLRGSTKKRQLLETFLPINLDDLVEGQKAEIQMCFRWAYFDCEEKVPMTLEANDKEPFFCVGQVVRAFKDR